MREEVRNPDSLRCGAVKDLRALRSRSLTASSLRLGAGYGQADACPFSRAAFHLIRGRFVVGKWVHLREWTSRLNWRCSRHAIPQEAA